MNRDYNLRNQGKQCSYASYDSGRKKQKSKLKRAKGSRSQPDNFIQASPNILAEASTLAQIAAAGTNNTPGPSIAASEVDTRPDMASAIESKLDQLLTQMTNMEQRVNNIEDKLDNTAN